MDRGSVFCPPPISNVSLKDNRVSDAGLKNLINVHPFIDRLV